MVLFLMCTLAVSRNLHVLSEGSMIYRRTKGREGDREGQKAFEVSIVSFTGSFVCFMWVEKVSYPKLYFTYICVPVPL